MSETQTPEPEVVDETAPVVTDVSADTPVTETLPETTETPESTQDATPKPNRGDRRFANLTARNVSLEAELVTERRAREAAEALVRAGKGEDDQAPTRLTETVEQAAARLVAQRDFEDRRTILVTNGAKEYGADDWNQKTAILASLGATSNQHFLEALVDQPNAAQLAVHLADDTDTLMALLRKPPVAMAAEMGRMAAKIEAQPVVKTPVSKAPTPVTPLRSTTVVRDVDPYQIKTAEEWKSYREKTAPKRLGGRG